MAVIKPMIRSNICINAHPAGCAKETENQIAYVKAQKAKRGTKTAKEGGYAPKTVLVLGCSTGYGLASRISAAFEYGADTIGVSFEKEATQTKGGTPGWYNNKAFDRAAKKDGLKSVTFNADAFSDECRATVIEEVKKWGAKFDLVVYSLASPVRTDPDTKVLYKSVIKPVGKVYGGPSLDMMTGKIGHMEAQPAEGDDIPNTVKVMGGEDWERWIKQLSEAGVLAEGCRTVAYSYIGPSLSHPIYRDGTIGEAKKDLETRAKKIDAALKANGGAAYVSVNKALITRSSSVIPIICQYIGVLFKIMKAKGTHEGCIEQMERLFAERLYTADKKVAVDADGRIRMDDWEMDPAVQAEVDKIMPQVTEANVNELVDMDAIRHDFLAINGFDIAGIDYEKDVADMTAID
ncbi:enoyl-ACP reductase FabV [Treponema sp.]|uniref:enoyl-ACP reductase FabV n=1 Tax=Treponema sp. TaxID=166 RepID=UPI002A84031E|nr:enoyl-ACP reductase FabV [Treponema sp.]MDY4132784.1 enoyl-ACP reductase FabV [Treponema sp.]